MTPPAETLESPPRRSASSRAAGRSVASMPAAASRYGRARRRPGGGSRRSSPRDRTSPASSPERVSPSARADCGRQRGRHTCDDAAGRQGASDRAEGHMRIESSVTSISWIPSEAIIGMTKLPFAMGVAHYDEPPPDEIDDLTDLQANDRFRFANELRAWVEVDGGRIVDHGFAGGGRIGSTTLKLGAHDMTLAATAFPDLRPDPEVG